MTELKEKKPSEEKNSLLKFGIYTAFVWAWAWIFGYFWFVNLRFVSFDTTFLLYLGPLVVTLIFLLINRHSVKDLGFIGFEEMKEAPSSLMIAMLGFFVLIILVLNVNVGIFFLNLPLINSPGNVLVYVPLMFFYMLALAFSEESAWSGGIYNFTKTENFIVKNLIISLIWFAWYVPYIIWILPVNSSILVTPLLLIVYLIYLIPTRFVFSWFREKSKSVYWPSFANSITGLANFIVVSLLGTLSPDGLIFFSLSTISSVLVLIILYFSFPLEKEL